MAKPTGGLLAFSARGSIAKTITFAAWRGRPYVRQHVIPANPRSTQQTITREVFSFLSASWKEMPADLQAAWTLAAKGLPVTDRNLWVKANLAVGRSQSSLDLFRFSPGAKGGLPPGVVTVSTPGAGDIDIQYDLGTVPPSWTITSVIGFALTDQDAKFPYTGVWAVDTGVGASGTISLTGLDSGTYQAGYFVLWMKPDGTPAYSPDAHDQVTIL